MARVQQTFQNDKHEPVYISVGPREECFELEPGDKLTLLFDANDFGDSIRVNVINERELVLWPNGRNGQLELSFNGRSAEGRSWNFKHR
jgi:hypothetical protein